MIWLFVLWMFASVAVVWIYKLMPFVVMVAIDEKWSGFHLMGASSKRLVLGYLAITFLRLSEGEVLSYMLDGVNVSRLKEESQKKKQARTKANGNPKSAKKDIKNEYIN